MKALDTPLVANNELGEVIGLRNFLKPDIDRRFDRSTEDAVIDLGGEARNDLSIDQPLNAGAGRVRAKPDQVP